MDRIYLNDGWLFTTEYNDALLAADADLSALKPVRIPHTVAETSYNYFDESVYQMVSGYRRVIEIEDAWREGHLFLTFEGAAHEATVYINGVQAARHYSGYTAFSVDMVPFLVPGREQIVTVRLDSRETLNQPPFGYVIDYMTYGGIYRDVYLDVKGKYYIDDVYVVTPDVLRDDKPLKCDVTVNETTEHMTIQTSVDIWTELPFDDESEDQHWTFDDEDVRFKVSCLTYTVNNAMNWDTDFPFLYTATITLKIDGQEVDQKKVRFGFREIAFEEDGFYLNGEKTKLVGLNRHQSWPYVGYAMPKSPQQLDADLLRYELACNVVRTSHYPQSQYFIDRCDEVGLLVFTEMPGWQHIGDTRWKKIAVRNVREMITQYRNHPSIILWGVRINESQDDDAFYYKTNQLAHSLDLYRPTGGVRFMKKSHLYEDVYTMNDFVHNGTNEGCTPKSKATSDMSKAHLITEFNGHMYPTKMFDDEPHRLEHALRYANVLADVGAEEDIAGCIGWCMFDYNTHKEFGSGERICYHGVMDMFRNPKMAAAVYKSQQDMEPVCVVSSSMNKGEYPACVFGDIYVFTNADSVRLYKGDVFIKEFFPDEKHYGSLAHPPIIIDDLVGTQMTDNEGYDPELIERAKPVMDELIAVNGEGNIAAKGKLAAIAAALHVDPYELVGTYMRYKGCWGTSALEWHFVAVKDDKVMAEVIKTPPVKPTLRIMADKRHLVEETSYDVATIQIEAVDEHGNHLDLYQEPLTLSAEGAVDIIGPKVVSLKGGYIGTYVRSLGYEGQGTLTITGPSGSACVDFSVECPLKNK